MYVEFMVGVLMTKLKDVFSLQITGEWGIEYTENETNTKVLRTTNFTPDGIINYSDVVLRCIHKDKVEKKKLRYGDIILEKSGGTEKTPVGRVVFCDESIEKDTYLCNNFTQAMRVNREIAVPKYVFYFMWNLHNSGKTELLQNKTTGIRNLQVKSYLNEEIPLPPLDEQRKIVAVLDKVSDLIAKRRQQLTKLDELVKARFVEMFGLGYSESTLLSLCNIIDYRGKTPPKVDFGLPFITAKNIKMHHMTLEPKEYISKETYNKVMVRGFPREGDVVFTTEAPLGNVCRIPHFDTEFYIGQRIVTLQTTALHPVYLEYALDTESFKQKIAEKSSGSTVTGIRVRLLEQLTIPVPPLKLQNQFAGFVERIEKNKAAIICSLEKLERLKQALMQEYFGV